MTRRGSIAGALLLTCVLACNAIAGINDPVDKTPGTTTGGVPPGVPPGGMDSGGPTPTGAARFVGTWTTNDATQSLSGCTNPAIDGTDTNVVQTLSFTQGDTSGTVNATNPLYDGCLIRYGVAGDVATVLSGESCTGFNATAKQDVTFAYVPPNTFTLEGATGAFARAHFTAQVDYQPASVQCLFEEISTYTKQ